MNDDNKCAKDGCKNHNRGAVYCPKHEKELVKKPKKKKPAPSQKRGLALLGLMLLSACTTESAPNPTAPTIIVEARNPSADATPVSYAVPTATPSPTVAPTSSPSASPSPTATPYAFSSGNGTAGSPYTLALPADVQHIADHPNAYYSMNQSINMGSVTFQPIPYFTGTIYGNNFELDNLTISGSGTQAFIGDLGGTVTAIKFYNVSIISTNYAAAIAGNVSGRISFCQVTGTVTSPQGGDGSSTGTGKPAYVTKTGAAVLLTNTQNVFFNSNHLTGSVF